tara:strand:+ start:16325 stop:17560 length:1236 start_codon:yes stop_codon:yes gene_type:complete
VKEETKPEVNIGLVGHVDHGKTTLVKALSGTWTDQHSEELKRGISIRLGYADTTFRKCPKCDGSTSYTISKTCPHHDVNTNTLRTVSFVDAPGHETLMATMLSGAALMDGAILVVSATESVPQPQTEEHLMALETIGISNIVIAQTKIDLVDLETAKTHYQQLKEFLSGTIANNAPIIPICADQNINMDSLIMSIEEQIPTPKRDQKSPPLMYVARSFDINRPGATWDQLVGGVLGGSLVQGEFSVGDEIEISPGRRVSTSGKVEYAPILATITSIRAGNSTTDKVTPGGLVGIGTGLDPSLTKSDGLTGRLAGKPGTLPPLWDTFTMDVKLLERIVGTSEYSDIGPINTGEILMLSIGTTTTVGTVTSARKSECEVSLKRPISTPLNSQIAISRRIGSRWRLIGIGTLIN